MSGLRVSGFMAAAVLLIGTASAAQTSAQTSAEPDQPAELVSEMWTMAGVCSQYTSFAVRGDALAAWLNDELAGHGQAETILDQHDAKTAAIAHTMEQLRAMPHGSARDQRLDENTASLMTRCRRLTSNPVAGRFFRNTRN